MAPGLIRTNIGKALCDNPEIRKAKDSKAVLKRIGQPDDIGGVAVFLGSAACTSGARRIGVKPAG